MTTGPLRTEELTRLISDLRDLLTELEGTHAPTTQRALNDALDWHYATKASGTGTPGGGKHGASTGSPVEAKMRGPDQAAQQAEWVIGRLRLLGTETRCAVIDLRGWRHDRPTALWPCGHVKAGGRDYKRCQECGSGATVLRCENNHCAREIPAGGQRRRVIAADQDNRELLECDRCYKYRVYKGRGLTWMGDAADRLALREGLVVAGEAYHG